VFRAAIKNCCCAGLVGLFAVMSAQAALNDPTKPPTAHAKVYVSKKKDKRQRWVLSSTLVSAQRRTAVINDRVVAVGDHVNGARVVSIQPSAVRLRMGRREISLMMLKKKIKTLSRVADSLPVQRQGK